MAKTIGGVILGYVVMFLCVFGTFSLAYLAMGPDLAFQPASYDVTALWLMTSFVLGALAAVAGGAVCAMLAPDPRASWILAGLVLVLGLLMASPVVLAPGGEPASRTSAVGNWEAMQLAQQPAWVALLNPVIGAAGTLLGAGLKGSARPKAGL